MTKTITVRMLCSMAGPDVSYGYGDTLALPAALAEAFCSDGRAERITPAATKPAPKPRKRAERGGSGPAGGAETR